MTKGCCSAGDKERLIHLGPIGTAARILLGLVAFGGAFLSLRAGGAWWVLGLALGVFGTLLCMAAVMREPGCEVNLIRARVLGKTPIGCFLFSPIDRWEQEKSK